jgi:hypothetical protein
MSLINRSGYSAFADPATSAHAKPASTSAAVVQPGFGVDRRAPAPCRVSVKFRSSGSALRAERYQTWTHFQSPFGVKSRVPVEARSTSALSSLPDIRLTAPVLDEARRCAFVRVFARYVADARLGVTSPSGLPLADAVGGR